MGDGVELCRDVVVKRRDFLVFSRPRSEPSLFWAALALRRIFFLKANLNQNQKFKKFNTNTTATGRANARNPAGFSLCSLESFP